jgi:hypothetical protein
MFWFYFPDITIIGSNAGVIRNFDLRAPQNYVKTWTAHSTRISALGIFYLFLVPRLILQFYIPFLSRFISLYHSGVIYVSCFFNLYSSDIAGSTLVSGSYDGTIKFWDYQNGKEISPSLSISNFRPPGNSTVPAVTGAEFVNGSKLLVSSSDTVLRLVGIHKWEKGEWEKGEWEKGEWEKGEWEKENERKENERGEWEKGRMRERENERKGEWEKGRMRERENERENERKGEWEKGRMRKRENERKGEWEKGRG